MENNINSNYSNQVVASVDDKTKHSYIYKAIAYFVKRTVQIIAKTACIILFPATGIGLGLINLYRNRNKDFNLYTRIIVALAVTMIPIPVIGSYCYHTIDKLNTRAVDDCYSVFESQFAYELEYFYYRLLTVILISASTIFFTFPMGGAGCKNWLLIRNNHCMPFSAKFRAIAASTALAIPIIGAELFYRIGKCDALYDHSSVLPLSVHKLSNTDRIILTIPFVS